MNVDINALTDKLVTIGQPLALQAWHIMVKQEITIGVLNIILAVALIGAILYGIHIFRRVDAALREQGYAADDTRHVLYVCSGVAFMVISFITIMLAYDGILHLMNPEYYALMGLLHNR